MPMVENNVNRCPRKILLPPTISNEALMLSCMIDAMEGQDVTISGIPDAFMQTPYDGGDVHIRIDGPMCMLLAKIDP